MSKIKSMSRGGWIVVGIIVALLLVPTAAYAGGKALKFTGIEGTSGNQADVTGAGQLLTTTVNPSSFFQNASQTLPATEFAAVSIATPPSGTALVVTSIHINVYSDPTPGIGYSLV